MATVTRDTTAWEFTDWVDLIPAPCSFVSSKWEDYEVHGETFHAANFIHADYLWLKTVIGRSGEEWGRCCHCNHAIRYAVVFRDPEGLYHMVGQDCAELIHSKLDKSAWREKQFLSEVKAVKTKNGERFTLKLPVPPWFWDTDRADRPKFCSLSKWEKPTRRGRVTEWSLTIWGETPGEVIRNYEELRRLGPVSR